MLMAHSLLGVDPNAGPESARQRRRCLTRHWLTDLGATDEYRPLSIDGIRLDYSSRAPIGQSAPV
jgi:hypothetical protein